MKKTFIFILLFMTNPCFAVPLLTTCPSGYATVTESAVVLGAGTCPSGHNRIGGKNSCLVVSPDNVCLMYADATTDLTDTSGILQFTEICPLTTDGASGVVKCVRLPTSIPCTGILSPGQADWTATCDGVTTNGMGICSSEYSASVGDKSDTPYVSEVVENNIYCWCKMTVPGISSWIFSGEAPTGATCSYACGRGCTLNLQDSSAKGILFRTSMFSNLAG